MDQSKISGSILILGRQPALGRAELESLYSSNTLAPLGERAILCSLPPEKINFARLGGSVRLASPLKVLNTDKWPEVVRQVTAHLPELIDNMPTEGKIRLGLSVFGGNIGIKQLFATGLSLKKEFKNAGRSVRLVPNTEPELSSAQLLHNQLTGNLGLELLVIQNGRQTFLARTLAVQDIEAYARRDQGRPKRDARVGMLPPKLAQIIVNMAVSDANPLYGAVVLDPFCGTGVVMQEAALMGFDVYGSDLDQRMVEYTDQNLMWLLNQPNCPVSRPVSSRDDPAWRYFRLERGDATEHSWRPLPNFIASEAYLGRPFSTQPRPETLAEVVQDVNTILEKFLQNVARQTKPNFRICIAVPAWRVGQNFKHLPLIDHLDKLGYNRVSFEHAKTEEMVYFRPNQIVARELLIITRK